MAVSPIAFELKRGEPLSAAVDMSGVTADAEGFFYVPGELVEISGNATVKKATTSGVAFGIITTGLNDGRKQGVTITPSTGSRVNVVPFKYQQAVVRCVAAEQLTAGQLVVLDTTAAGKVKVTTTKADAFGIVWVGGAANAVVQILV